ncbi:hypothetical protein SDRG_10188 [Saprolegnia diclina VS20]|uniref:choline-phosphate cytidylyltransferase n=1 Tax=Saprolegnia diclina (strain VS20) TaxID=1156394 RepID=T0RI77_SAPDV|nr:hypothetical protein SDRG_10188 [Saprolegnia diclina VS20]EQC31988.1 hypothetical protein SDRG_10188 [Saprolegnia diclina VS20]|eukprot:XP_008614390.1 hypothetical protein SDRG_10188 [Saprolegnia diclina VS20]
MARGDKRKRDEHDDGEDHHAQEKHSTQGSGDESDTSDEEKPLKPVPEASTRRELKEGEPGSLTGRPLRLFADGIFDLFHFGHARALQQCKQAYPNVYLLVGCCNDEMTHRLKGRTVMSEEERYESLRHCKWVDEVIEGSPWVLTDEFLDKHQIDYVCHDAIPYTDSSGQSGDGGDVYAHIKAIGKFHETQRTDGISTSDLIIRIISEYDTFIRRNLQRGYSGKEMNVPFMKEKAIKLDMAMDKVKHDIEDYFHKVFGKADDVQHSFLNLFSKEGALRTSLRKRRKILRESLADMAREGLC